MNVNWDLVGTIGAARFVVPFCIIVGIAIGRFVASVFLD